MFISSRIKTTHKTDSVKGHLRLIFWNPLAANQLRHLILSKTVKYRQSYSTVATGSSSSTDCFDTGDELDDCSDNKASP
jgi:hypothetical protein